MRKIVVYLGIIFLPDKNALCQRAKGILKSVEQLGYETVTIGVNKDLPLGTYRKLMLDEKKCYEISYPTDIKGWLANLISAKEFIDILQEIGCENIKSLIMADYRFWPTVKLKKFCKENEINFIADIMDWFIPGNDIVSLIKQIDTWLRINVVYPKIERKICICNKFAKKYKKTKHIQVIPGTVDPYEEKWSSSKYKAYADRINIIFAGQPGKKCTKEKIDWVIRAMYEEDSDRKLHLYLVGVEETVFKKENIHLIQYLDNINIHYLGKLDHLECVKLIIMADFSLIIRKKNRLSEYGFPTKISEAFACGTPVLATDTSDIKEYIVEGENGFVCKTCYEGVQNMIRKIVKMEKGEITNMLEKTKVNNKLVFSRFTELLRKVL